MRSTIQIVTWLAQILAYCVIGPVSSALAEPPGFRRIQITDSPDDLEFDPRINDRGDIVWSSRIGGFDQEKYEEIYLFSDGQTFRLTTDDIQDRLPDINNDAVVVWSRRDGPTGRYGPTAEIVRWRDGLIDYITDDGLEDIAPHLNNHDAVVWSKFNNRGCGGSNGVIELFHEDKFQHLTDGSHSDQGARINSDGTIVWTRYNFCKDPWEGKILMRDADGSVTQLSDGVQPQVPCISPTGVVGWTDLNALYVWNNGIVTQITDDGRNPLINSRGDIAFIRWNDPAFAWETWLCVGGEFRPIAASSEWEISCDMNEAGDIVVQRGRVALDKTEIVLYQRLHDGDMNCDGKVTFEDIDGFTLALIDRAEYEAAYPDCDWWLADSSGDRKVDFDDIDPFVECIIKGCER